MSRLLPAPLRAGLVCALILSSAVRLPAQEARAPDPYTAEEVLNGFILGLASDAPTVKSASMPAVDGQIDQACTEMGSMTLSALADFEAMISRELEKDLTALAEARKWWKEQAKTNSPATSIAKDDCVKKAREAALTLYVNKRLIPCIRQRQGDLRRPEVGLPAELAAGDRRLDATWVTGKCEGQYGGFEADWKGGITMILHPGGSAEGTIYSGPHTEGGPVLKGTHHAGGHFEAFGPPTPSDVYVRLEGTVSPAAPGVAAAKGSGTLKYGGGGGPSSWTCWGTWSSN